MTDPMTRRGVVTAGLVGAAAAVVVKTPDARAASTTDDLLEPIEVELERLYAEILRLQGLLDAERLNTERLTGELAAAHARIAELEAQLKPPPPPWDYFRRPGGPGFYMNVPLGRGDLKHCGYTPIDLIRFEPDVEVYAPEAPPRPILQHTGAWSEATIRCATITGAPVTKNGFPQALRWSTDWADARGSNPEKENQSGVIIDRDANGDLVGYETQPLIKCTLNGEPVLASTNYRLGYGPVRLGDDRAMPGERSDGTAIEVQGCGGAHGGSGIPALGGNIDPYDLEVGVIDHAMKLVLNTRRALIKLSVGKARWPAFRYDSGWAGYGADRADPGPAGLLMGALLALRDDFDVEQLAPETDSPARMIARGFMTYGAYVCDSNQSPPVTTPVVFSLCTTQGYRGDTVQAFYEKYGYEWKQRKGATGKAGRWLQDMSTVHQALHLVDDNHLASIGGAGPRRSLR